MEDYIMKTFINDYADLCKHTAKFYKKHMLGVTVVNTAIVGGKIRSKTKLKRMKQSSNLISQRIESNTDSFLFA